MESVTIKVEEALLKRMDESMKKKGYSTKTEFIREAIRDKLDADEREELMRTLMRFKGMSKKKTTPEENRKTREGIVHQLAKEFGIDV